MDPHHTVGGVHPLPVGKAVFSCQTAKFRIRKDRKLLVGSAANGHRNAEIHQGGTDLHCHGIGVGGKLKIEVVLHELLELDTEKPSLRQHAAPLFDEIAEIFSESRVCDDHSLPEESSLFRTA